VSRLINSWIIVWVCETCLRLAGFSPEEKYLCGPLDLMVLTKVMHNPPSTFSEEWFSQVGELLPSNSIIPYRNNAQWDAQTTVDQILEKGFAGKWIAAIQQHHHMWKSEIILPSRTSKAMNITCHTPYVHDVQVIATSTTVHNCTTPRMPSMLWWWGHEGQVVIHVSRGELGLVHPFWIICHFSWRVLT